MTYIHRPVPVDASDLQRYIDQELRELANQIAVMEEVISELVIAGYGGGVQEADIPLFNIPALTYVALPIDTLSPAVQRGMTTSLTNNTVTFTVAGTWRLNIEFNLENIIEQNASRVFNLRAWNVTDSAQLDYAAIPVSRNQGDVFMSWCFLAEIPDSLLNKEIRMEVGGVDAVDGGTLINASVQANFVSEIGLLE